MRRRHQRVHRQQAERRRTVDDDVRVVLEDGRELVLEPEMRIELAHQLRLELGERNPRRCHPQIVQRRRDDDVCQARLPVRHRVVHAFRDLADVEKRHRAVRLRVEIDEEGPLAAQRQRGREIDGGGRLADSAFLVRDGDNHQPSINRVGAGAGKLEGF